MEDGYDVEVGVEVGVQQRIQGRLARGRVSTRDRAWAICAYLSLSIQ